MSEAYLQNPALGQERLFFISENSLWSVPCSGGEAKRLVSGEGVVSQPLLSPDCNLIAYAFNEEGSVEVYVMPAKGGEATRLTYHNVPSYPAGWSPDSRTLYVRSTMRSASNRVYELFRVSVEGGDLIPMNIGHALWIDIHPDGSRALIGKHSLDVARWKRYRGGLAGTIWRGTLEAMEFEPLLDHEAGHVMPQFDGGRVLFLSDRDGVGNLYSVEWDGTGVSQLTDHRDYFARSLSVRGGRAAYQHAGDIYLHEKGRSRRLDIDLGSPLKPEKSYFVDIGKYTEGMGVSEDGKCSLFTIRGKPVVSPNWSGAVRQMGVHQGVRYRFCQYTGDEADVLCVSDESGEEEVEIRPQSFKKQPIMVARLPEGYITHFVASHDGRAVVCGTNRRKLYLLDVAAKSWTLLDESRYASWGKVDWSPAWSPDDRYIAYAKMEDEKYSIFLYDKEEKRIIRATDSEFHDMLPDFDPGGRYLYFTSLRYINPYRDYLDVGYAYPSIAKPYLLVLKRDTPLPFIVPHETGEEKDEERKEKEQEKVAVQIDEEGLAERVFEFPDVKASSWCQPVGLKNKVVLASWPLKGMLDEGLWYDSEPKDEIKLEIYDLVENRLDPYVGNAGGFSFSRNRKWIIYRSAGKYRVKKAGEKEPEKSLKDEKPGKRSGLLDLGKIRMKVDLRAEWAQIFRETWRYQREHFWNEQMSGVDWHDVRERYLPLLKKVNTREELDDLLWEMQGELGTSHAYSFGGDLEKSRGYRVGLLGADFSFDREKGLYRIAKIYRGDTFYADKHSPLSLPGVNAEEGSYLLAIDGERIEPRRHPYAYLVGRVKTESVLLISDTGKAEDARELTVKTIPSELPLRYREWVKANMRYVAEKTGGRVGYFHIPDMMTSGIVEFDRYFYQIIHREGLIIDIRHNSGGYISQRLLQKLYRRMVGFVRSRWGNRDETIPDNTFRGVIVVIADEFSGSDGDIFPQSFKNLQMGTVVGKRTWGGVVGITMNTVLVDRGFVTQPEYAIWFREQGFRVENHGVDPDIEVDNDPASVARGEDRQLDTAIVEVERLMEKSEYYVPEFESIKKTSLGER